MTKKQIAIFVRNDDLNYFIGTAKSSIEELNVELSDVIESQLESLRAGSPEIYDLQLTSRLMTQGEIDQIPEKDPED